jgi:hypothetical protein
VIRVLLAEDQAMVRGALSALLRLEHDISVEAEVARVDQVIPAALLSGGGAVSFAAAVQPAECHNARTWILLRLRARHGEVYHRRSGRWASARSSWTRRPS